MPMFGDRTEAHIFPHPHGDWVGTEDIPTAVGPFPGSLAPDFHLPRPDGDFVFLQNLHGKRVLLFAWGPWAPARNELPKLQRFYQTWQPKGLEVLAVAHDATGPERAATMCREAKATYPLLIDRDNSLARLYSYKQVPLVILIDEFGAVRYRSVGTFTFDKPEEVRPIERFLSRPLAQVQPARTIAIEDELARLQEEAESWGDSYLDMDLASTYLQLDRPVDAIEYYERAIADDHPWPWAAAYGIGVAAAAMGRTGEAVKYWAGALRDDPENDLIRLQLWSAQHPERFYPDFDLEWQDAQRRVEERERAHMRSVARAAAWQREHRKVESR